MHYEMRYANIYKTLGNILWAVAFPFMNIYCKAGHSLS